MQQQQRFILFLVLSMALFFAWFTFGPQLFPALFPQRGQLLSGALPELTPPAPQKPASKKTVKSSLGKRVAKTAPVEAPRPGREKKPLAHVALPKKQPGASTGKTPPTLPQHPGNAVVLGSLHPESGFFLQAELSPKGAAVRTIRLNDERYRTVKDRREQLRVVGDTATTLMTCQTTIPAIDKPLQRLFRTSLNELNWEVAEKSDVTVKVNGRPQRIVTAVTFAITSPDGRLRVSKRYALHRVDLDKQDLRSAQNTASSAYELDFRLKIENLGDEEQTVAYRLQGPVGLPLEDPENLAVYRSVVTGFAEEDGSVKTDSLAAKKVAEADNPEEWERPIAFIGVDVQYFAALLFPPKDQRKSQSIKLARPVVVEKSGKLSDVSVELQSQEFTLAAHGGDGSSITHHYRLYAGPKKKQLLETYQADGIIQYGWFGFIARGMLWLLNFFHRWGLPYGLAIILLTFVVRGAMFPLSKKQARSAAKMKELQPKIAELKKKLGNDREKLARAQMELFAKHGYNPFAGCLPIFLQLPIFIGLYQALRNAVELRLAPFPLTWIDNLAAPDALLELPFRIPFLGSSFNLLPIITVALFVFQQKMFMPPPVDDQQAMQHKMMMWMSIFFGFLFYRVPSGLCIYFIASSLWGMAERKLLDRGKSPSDAPSAAGSEAKRPAGSPTGDGSPKPQGFFGKLLQMADEAAKAKVGGNGNSAAEKSKKGVAAPPGGGGRRKKGRKNRRSQR